MDDKDSAEPSADRPQDELSSQELPPQESVQPESVQQELERPETANPLDPAAQQSASEKPAQELIDSSIGQEVASVGGDAASQPAEPVPDARLYIPDNEDWEVHIKRDSDKLYCYSKSPGEDWFHLLLSGEIYVSRQHERYCLRCALRMGFLTDDRLFWQHRVPKRRNRTL